MKLLDDLRTEHLRIEQVAGSLRTFAEQHARGEAQLSDLARFMAFFEIYAGAFHHEREEEILVPALTEGAGLPGDRGPLAVIIDDHVRMGGVLARLKVSTEPAEITELAKQYVQALWLHIDVENSVLFPEGEDQLRRSGVYELPAREATPEEAAAAAEGDALIALYRPMEPDIVRGDGCVMCHAFGDTCRGLEREWWNEWTWEELDEHIAAG